MQIKQETTEKAGRFYIEENNSSTAELDYQFTNNKILLITHTEVNESLTGKGIGKQLVGAAVSYARSHSMVVKATCSFAKAILDKATEFADVYHAKKNKS